MSPPQARQELNPSHVSAYLRIKREPPEVEDTCISGDSSHRDLRSRLSEQIIIYKKRSKDSPKEFGAQRGREVLGEE